MLNAQEILAVNIAIDNIAIIIIKNIVWHC